MIESISIKKGCITCKNCETVCPSIFKVQKTSQVISQRYQEHWQQILQAEAMCPVQVIDVEKSGNLSLDFKKAIIKEKNYLTNDIIELVFQTENFSFVPGQYISLQMKDWRGQFSRSYSIASSTSTQFTLIVKLLENGRGAQFLRKLKQNKKVDYLGPHGNFVLQNTNKKKVFIATGTGLAPMVAMLDETPSDIEKIVIFGVRTPKDIYYEEVLEKFENTKVITTVSRPDDSWNGNTGRVTNYLEGLPRDAEIYICGNPDMIEFVVEYLKEEGYRDDQIFYEGFTVSPHTEQSIGKEIFFNGTLPGVRALSWGTIFFTLFIIPYLLFYHASEFRGILWDISWWAVVFVMIIRPLADIFPKLGILRRLVTLRKAFGILSSGIVVANLLFVYIGNPSLLLSYLQLEQWGLAKRAIFGRLTEITGMVLLITSNRFSQQKLGIWWKRIQNTAYIYFFAAGVFVARYGSEMKYYIPMFIVGILWFLAKYGIRLWK